MSTPSLACARELRGSVAYELDQVAFYKFAQIILGERQSPDILEGRQGGQADQRVGALEQATGGGQLCDALTLGGRQAKPGAHSS